jgi:hypothetical protein
MPRRKTVSGLEATRGEVEFDASLSTESNRLKLEVGKFLDSVRAA